MRRRWESGGYIVKRKAHLEEENLIFDYYSFPLLPIEEEEEQIVVECI